MTWEDFNRGEAHLKTRDKVHLNELQGVVQLIAQIMDKLTVMENSTTNGFGSKLSIEVDQHLQIIQSFKPSKFKGVSDPIML